MSILFKVSSDIIYSGIKNIFNTHESINYFGCDDKQTAHFGKFNLSLLQAEILSSIEAFDCAVSWVSCSIYYFPLLPLCYIQSCFSKFSSFVYNNQRRLCPTKWNKWKWCDLFQHVSYKTFFLPENSFLKTAFTSTASKCFGSKSSPSQSRISSCSSCLGSWIAWSMLS